jgi:hypothetical protein
MILILPMLVLVFLFAVALVVVAQWRGASNPMDPEDL